jgi:hypothetical protein
MEQNTPRLNKITNEYPISMIRFIGNLYTNEYNQASNLAQDILYMDELMHQYKCP